MINDFGSLFWSHASLRRLIHNRIRGTKRYSMEPSIFAIVTTTTSHSRLILVFCNIRLSHTHSFTHLLMHSLQDFIFFSFLLLFVCFTYCHFICLCCWCISFTAAHRGFCTAVMFLLFLLLFFKSSYSAQSTQLLFLFNILRWRLYDVILASRNSQE